MSLTWGLAVLLIAECTFAVLFARSLVRYLHRRDPLQRDTTWVFAAPTVQFATSVVNLVTDSVPPWIRTVTAVILIAQPFLTVRLVARLRHVPRGIESGMLLTYVFVAATVLFAGLPLPPPILALTVVWFLGGEVLAAVLLIGKARSRTGANRWRLAFAAGATVALGLMIVLLGLAAQPRFGTEYATAGRVLAVVSGLGYLIAFVPPRWLQRAFSASAAQSVSERLLRAPVDSPEQVWQTYAGIMRVQTGADAVAVLMPRPDGLLAPMAYSGPPIETPDDLGFSDITALIRQDRPVRLREGNPALVAHFGDDLSDDFVTVLAMPVPPDVEGAVLLFNRHRTLFRDDDLRLLAALGGQAGVLAERQAVLLAQRRMADELSASVEALTRASQAKSTFLANMSHELRTPLNAIIGFSDLMRMEEPDGDRRRVPAEWVEHIHTSGRHLLGLINDILDLAKVEAGRLDLRLGPLRVDTAVTELLDGLAPLIATKQLTVQRDLPEVTALADRVRFRQIVENLLSNAIKFTPAGGRITLSVRAEVDDVWITVADTGVGIAAADQARVFEEFQQVGDDEGRRAGTGLGLALTRRLVEAHEGAITLESTPGEGSSFAVRLPAAPVIRTVTEEPAPGPRVLLIEDDPQSAELLQTQLSSAGYAVEVAPSGEDGLTSAGQHPPDAIVLDVGLPGIDGWEVIRRLKADERLAGIPVFFATIVDERQDGLALGADDYFVKPVDQGALLGALARVVAARPVPRVLVVDHDDDVRRAIEEGLRAGGADVVACADGRDGLALSRTGRFDLIVSGGVLAEAMSGGAGWETLAPLLGSRQAPRKDVP